MYESEKSAPPMDEIKRSFVGTPAFIPAITIRMKLDDALKYSRTKR